MQCPACGAVAIDKAVYCHKCGRQLQPADDAKNSRQSAGPTLTESVNPVNPTIYASRTNAGQPETELWRGGYSSKAMAGGWVISGLVSLGLLAAGLFWAQNSTWWLVLIAFMLLPWLYYLSVLCYRRMSVSYLLTSQRFMHESGLLRRINDRVELLDMDDIRVEQGLLDRMVGVGTIRIMSSDRSHPDLELSGIENVNEVSRIFDNARIAERRLRGLHVEQIQRLFC